MNKKKGIGAWCHYDKYTKKNKLRLFIYTFETFSTFTQTFSACAQLFRHPV